ncbi:metal-dependent hydrolase [Actinospongicola halichondriae]|uniref:metal-dependent hydrolase n=1 Tax=Actinospongicola halichondriae TaxID=3236844 RepID=UPI003D4F017E
MTAVPGPVVRRVRFAWPDDFDPIWTRTPELAISANAVSLLMPHVEPYVVDAVADTVGDLEGNLAVEARAFVRQERQHHGQHRRFNDVVISRFPALRVVERLMAWTFGLLRRRMSARFALAFAAGFETVAFSAARWTAARQQRFFDGADPTATSLFLWHLAEEVEHKGVAHDVYEASGGGRVRYVFAMTLSMLLLAVFTTVGALSMLWTTRRIFHPLAHLRMLVWSISFLFELLPNMAISVLPGHHPADFVDPMFFAVDLHELDSSTA